MYTHILVPTDGSALSDKAVESAIKLAKWRGDHRFMRWKPYPLQARIAARPAAGRIGAGNFAERSEEYAKRVPCRGRGPRSQSPTCSARRITPPRALRPSDL